MLKKIAQGLALAAALSLPTAAQAAETLKIGYSIAKTGLFSQAAPSQVNAYDLWAEQVN